MNIYVDIDNTICITDDSYGLEKYNKSIPLYSKIHHINELYEKGNRITYWTARGNQSGIDYRELTMRQLVEWGCKYHELIMGSKPSFDLLIDDKAMNPKDISDPPTNSIKQTPKVVPKGWGHEVIFVNNDKYCGKILHFKKDAKFSMHYHILKTETWYVHSGIFLFKYIDTRTADIHEMTLSAGDTITNAIGEPHQLICIEEGDVFEVSTTHNDNDSYRVFKGDSQCTCEKDTKAILFTHVGLGDIILCNGIINYLAEKYTFVTVVIQKCYSDTIKDLYKYNSNILFYEISSESDFSKWHGCPTEKYDKLVQGAEVYAVGTYTEKIYTDARNFPFCFYDELNIPRSVFWTHQRIEKNADAKMLYDMVKNYPYIFITNRTSQGEYFDINTALNKLNINKDDLLVISPHVNVYSSGHRFYDIAQVFLTHRPLTHYTDILENASVNILSDSSIYSLCHLLNIKTDKNYVIARPYRDFSIIYKKETFEKEDVPIRVKFQQIAI